VELLPGGEVFLGKGGKLLGYPTQFMGNGDEPLDELGKESNGGGFSGESVGQHFGAEVREDPRLEAKGTPGLGLMFRHEG